MKRPSNKRKKQERIRRRIRERRARRRRSIKSVYRKRKEYLAYQQQKFAEINQFNMPKSANRIPLKVPDILSLKENYSETVELILEVRRYVFVENMPVMLFFNNLKTVEPAALLLLTAEIFRCRHLRAGRHGTMVNGNYPNDHSVLALLREMGFYKLLDVSDLPFVEVEPKDGEPFFVPFRTSNRVEPELAANFCELVQVGAFKMGQLASGKMVGALKEAMGNSYEHGYGKSQIIPAMPRRWWIGGYIDPERREMMLLIVDQGVGIPATLEPELFDNLRSTLGNLTWQPSDGRMIHLATELHRSTTGEKFRGKGFRDMKAFIDTCDDGELLVLSNRGAYRYSKHGAEDIHDESQSIGGTLIQWRIRHSSDVEDPDA